jgi:peptidoglycan/LPS O-acetylase OafA/YrhL
LDALRGVAAMMVLIYHYTDNFAVPQSQRTALALPFVHLGAMGVELFFIISGFVIYMTIERTATIRGFAISRFARLYPTFVACLGVTLAASVLVEDYGAEAWHISLYRSMLIANLTTAPTLFNRSAVDPSYWSLGYELAFYTLAATATYLGGWRSPERLALGWLAITAALRLSGVADRWPRLELLTAANFAYLFVIGVMLFRHWAGQATQLTYWVLGIALATSLFGSSRLAEGLPEWSYPVLIVSYSLLVWVATCRSVGIFHRGILPFLGDISYPLYLVHQVAGYVVIQFLLRRGTPLGITVITTGCIAVVVAWCISVTIERPARRFLRAWLDPEPERPRNARLSDGGA